MLNICDIAGGTVMEQYTEVSAGLMVKLLLLLVQTLGLEKKQRWTLLTEVAIIVLPSALRF